MSILTQQILYQARILMLREAAAVGSFLILSELVKLLKGIHRHPEERLIHALKHEEVKKSFVIKIESGQRNEEKLQMIIGRRLMSISLLMDESARICRTMAELQEALVGALGSELGFFARCKVTTGSWMWVAGSLDELV